MVTSSAAASRELVTVQAEQPAAERVALRAAREVRRRARTCAGAGEQTAALPRRRATLSP